MPAPTAGAARGYRFGQVVSYVVNPFVLPPATYALMLAYFQAPVAERVAIVAVATVCFSLVPLGFVLYRVHTGRARSVEVRDRAARITPMLFSLVSSLAGLALMARVGVTLRGFVVASAACYVLNLVLALLVTTRWKISLHLIGISGFLATLVFVARTTWPLEIDPGVLSAAWLVPAFALVPLLMWARVRTGAHTRSQVWAGALLGFALPYGELYVLAHHVLDVAV